MDFGKIKINNKLYGEQNHPDTLLARGYLSPLHLVISDGPHQVKTINTAGLIIVDSHNDVDFVPVPEGEAGYNKLLATNEHNNLVWIDR